MKRKRGVKKYADDDDDAERAAKRSRATRKSARVVTDVERCERELRDANSLLATLRNNVTLAHRIAERAHARAYSGVATPLPTPQYVKSRVFEIDPEHMCSHLTLQYGKDNGYFDCDLVCIQFAHAMVVARAKYGDVDIRFLIDHSSNHFAMASDGLNAYAMSKSDNTTSQPHMRDTKYVRDGTTYEQKVGKQRGLASVLEERGIDIEGKKLKELRDIMAQQPDFVAELSRIEQLARDHRVRIVRGVKFHPELMPIEQVNGAMKCSVRKRLTGSIVGLAEMCYETLAKLDHQFAMRFSRKSYGMLLCYKTGNWKSQTVKRRRTGQGKELVPAAPPIAVAAADVADDDEDDGIDAELGLEAGEADDE